MFSRTTFDTNCNIIIQANCLLNLTNIDIFSTICTARSWKLLRGTRTNCNLRQNKLNRRVKRMKRIKDYISTFNSSPSSYPRLSAANGKKFVASRREFFSPFKFIRVRVLEIRRVVLATRNRKPFFRRRAKLFVSGWYDCSRPPTTALDPGWNVSRAADDFTARLSPRKLTGSPPAAQRQEKRK